MALKLFLQFAEMNREKKSRIKKSENCGKGIFLKKPFAGFNNKIHPERCIKKKNTVKLLTNITCV